MKYVCNARQEGKCKHGAGKCNHYGQHEPDLIVLKVPGLASLEGSPPTKFCTEERFCEVQNEMVHCIELVLFPAMVNSIIIPEDLAKEFVEWAKDKSFCNSGQHICDKLADHIEQRLKIGKPTLPDDKPIGCADRECSSCEWDNGVKSIRDCPYVD